MPRLYLRLILAAIAVALLSISTGAALAAPPQQDRPPRDFEHVLPTSLATPRGWDDEPT